jgi:hypothetical protein
MAAAMYELSKSRAAKWDLKNPSAQLNYIITDGDDEVAVVTLIESTLPATFLGLVFTTYAFNHQGRGVWFVDAEYGLPTEPDAAGRGDEVDEADEAAPPAQPSDDDALTSEYGFSFAEGTTHIVQSLETVESKRINNVAGVPAAKDYKRAIGVVESTKKVEGTDIKSGYFEFTITRKLAFITPRFIRRIRDRIFRTNNDTWYGFAAGELLFLGATGQCRDGEAWSVTWRFAVGENETDVEICDGLTIASKKAWEYLWVTYQETIAADEYLLTPYDAFVERVYHTTDFTKLGC